MSLQPSDPASEAFERLRLEIALLRRAVEGLAAERDAPAVDYSPTLAGLRKAVGEVKGAVEALGERPLLVLAPEQLVAVQDQLARRLLAKPIAELEHERTMLAEASAALRAARADEAVRTTSSRRRLRLVGGGMCLGALLWGVLLGPFARALPASWGAPERLAADTLGLPIGAAGERLLRRGDPAAWDAMQLARRLSDSQRADLQRCISRSSDTKIRTCTLKLRVD